MHVLHAARRLVLTAVAAAAVVPATVAAQAVEGLPFQPGRWAIEVSSEQGVGNLGFLRFTSPGSAWLIAPGIILGRGEIRQQDPFGGPDQEAEISTLGFDLRAGFRRYQALGRGVVSHLGAGALVQMTQDEAEADDGTSAETSTTAFGAYGELGGSYFFTPRFGLGASAVASLVRESFEDDSFGAIEGDAWTFALPQARLHVTVVF